MNITDQKIIALYIVAAILMTSPHDAAAILGGIVFSATFIGMVVSSL